MLQRQGYPFVVVDPREPPPDGIPCVSAMHAAGAKQATEHLLELGHRRIGAIAGTPGWYATEERLIGFRAALAGGRDPARPGARSPTPTGGRRAAPKPPSSCCRCRSRRQRSSGSTTTSRSASLHAARARGLSGPGGSLGGRVRRHVAGDDRHAAPHVRAPAARGARADGGQPADAHPRRAARRRAADRALDEARRARNRRRPRGSRLVRLAIVAVVAVCGIAIGAALALGGSPRRRVRRASPRLRPARSCGARRRAPRQRLGPRGQPDRAVVDDERGELDEHALFGRGAQAAADRARAPAARPVSSCTRARSFRSRAAACRTPRVSSMPARTGSCAPGRRRCRAAGRPSPRSSSTREPRRRSSAASRSTARASSRPTSTTRASTSTTPTGIALRIPGAFVDASIPTWYAPFGIQAIDGHVFVTYVYRAPVNGNDAPTGGYVDEFDRNGKLVARVGHGGVLNAPWGLAQAPRSFGRFGGDLLIGNFGDGRINAYRRSSNGLVTRRNAARRSRQAARRERPLGPRVRERRHGRPAGTLFFTSGPHVWRGETELACTACSGRSRPA